MPRRIGCLVEDIVDYSNLYESLNYVLRGKRKKSASGKKLWRHYELTIRTLQAEIRQDRFRLKHYRETTLTESGFIYKAADGKKRFNVPKYRLAELMNQTITVTDYEDGVKNHEGAERMIIRFTNQDGTEGKFWTGSEEMRQALHFMDEQDKLPFVATIKQKPIGNGKYMYVFT